MKISSLIIPEELKKDYWEVMQILDPRVNVSIRTRKERYKEVDKHAMRLISPFLQNRDDWLLVTDFTKSLWALAGRQFNMNGWQYYLKEYEAKKKAEIIGVPVISLIHSAFAGMIKFTSGNVLNKGLGKYKLGKFKLGKKAGVNELKIIQDHPNTQEIIKKWDPRLDTKKIQTIQEHITLPIRLDISYRADFQKQSENSEAYLKLYVISRYQGRDIAKIETINFLESTGWIKEYIEILEVTGQVDSYFVEMYFKNITGEIYFDNLFIDHTGETWARDPQFDNFEDRKLGRNLKPTPAWRIETETGNIERKSIYPPETIIMPEI